MKTLIVFYSLEGNTRYAAKKLAEELGADLLELKPKREYPRGSSIKYVTGGFAAGIGARPRLCPYSCDLTAYQLIVLGSPVWNSRITPPLNTFLSEQDLTGKTIAAFACHGGGGAQKLFSALEAKLGHLAATASFLDPASHQEQEQIEIEKFAEELETL